MNPAHGAKLSPLLAGFLLVGFSASPGSAQSASASAARPYDLHYQFTAIAQGHPSFKAPYDGPNSLQSRNERATSVTSTLFLGVRLRKGSELYVNPELAGGKAVSGALGMAGFANGEGSRVGDPTPEVSLARMFLRQTFGLGGGSEQVEEGPNRLAGTQDASRVVLTLGKFAITDIFDANRYSDDPRSQFLNWALMESGAWDYPADTRGYCWGAAGEYFARPWAFRAGAVTEPKEANMKSMDTRLGRTHGLVAEGEYAFRVADRKGAARLLLFFNEARMGSYRRALDVQGAVPDVRLTRDSNRTKYGFALSADQELSEDWGAFLRAGWNDGRNESWAFTEIDRSLAFGAVRSAKSWGRPKDELAFAGALNGLSADHREYLAAGGTGFIIGDGALLYGPEIVLEAYYKLQLTELAALTPDYQFAVNPAYNRDRGPVNLWALRFHVEF